METGECVQTLHGHEHVVKALTLSKKGELVSGSYDKTIKVWRLDTGECLRTMTGHTNWVKSLTINKNGHLFSCSSDYQARIWNIESGKCLKTLSPVFNGNASLVHENQFIINSTSDIEVWNFHE